MKKIILLTILISGYTALQAQSLEQGNQYLYYERYQTAENVFHQILNQDPNQDLAWYELTKAYLPQNKMNKASDSIAQAPASVRSQPYYKVALGWLALHQNKKEEAQNHFNHALEETREKDAGILAAVAEAHINSTCGDGDYAVRLVNKAIKRDKKSAALYVTLGDAYRKLLNGTEAYKAYQEAIEKDSRHAVAYYRIGEIFLSQKNAELYVEYFKKAIAADPNYAPALYKLYAYELYHDPSRSMEYYKNYAANSDLSIQNEYDVTDLLYLNKWYDDAIQKANAIITSEKDKAQPRLYKLIAYSHAADKDTIQAVTHMQQYFEKEADSNLISKDYASMSQFYSSLQGQDSLAAIYLAKATVLENDSATLYDYYKQLADMAKKRKDYAARAQWLGKYYLGNDKATNLDLFYWGLANYRSADYVMADSVFGVYVTKYPDQSFGYYWQAKSKASLDNEMKEGLAIPAYQKLIEILQKDTSDANYKKWIVEAYAYLAAYKANTEKDYAGAVDYFQKVLEVDPENESAKKYIGILENSLADRDNK